MVFYCFGDSHSIFFSGNNDFITWPNKTNNLYEQFKAYRIKSDGTTAYNLDKYTYILDEILEKENFNKINDTMVFCFGEIDCRLHIGKQKILRPNEELNDIIEICVNKYFLVIQKYINLGYKIIIWGPIASTPFESYPERYRVGTCKQRNIITYIFHEKLRKLCETYKVDLITLFYDMLLNDYSTNPKYLADELHLSQNVMSLAIKKFELI